jgi:hypothetical protein
VLHNYNELHTTEFLRALDEEPDQNVKASISGLIMSTPPQELPSTNFDRISMVSNDQFAALQAGAFTPAILNHYSTPICSDYDVLKWILVAASIVALIFTIAYLSVFAK